MTAIETTIKEIIPRTHNVKSFRVARGDGFEFAAGQFMRVTVPVAEGEQTRSLSFSSSPAHSDYFEFTKKITDSGFSKKLDSLKAGDPVKIKGPMGRFTQRDGENRVAFLSGGIGITPIRGICEDIIAVGRGVDMVLLYGNRAVDDIAFKEDFDAWEKKREMRVVHFLEKAPGDGSWSGRAGYITGAIIKEEVPDYMDRLFYICGPTPMVEILKKILTEKLQLSDERVVTENFVGYK